METVVSNPVSFQTDREHDNFLIIFRFTSDKSHRCQDQNKIDPNHSFISIQNLYCFSYSCTHFNDFSHEVSQVATDL